MPTTLPALPRRNAPWTPFQRRTWLAERRQRLLPAPVLRAAFPASLQWDWDLPNPFKWNVWMSMDGGASWMLVADYWAYGVARQFAPDGGGELYYIVGIDGTGREITRHSNLARPDDAPVPLLLAGLAGYWKLEEADGEVRADATGNGMDMVEWAHYDETPVVGQTAGVLGNAAAFSDDNDWGLMAAGSAGWDNTADFTIAGWFQFTLDNYNAQFVFNIGESAAVQVCAYIGALAFSVKTDNAAGYCSVQTAGGTVPEGIWKHCAAVKAGNTLTLYLDGVASASGTVAGAAVPEWAPDLHLGCAPWGYPLNGALDEFGLWQRALSAAEVAQLCHHGSGWPLENF